MSRLNWNRPRKVFQPWYDRDLFPTATASHVVTRRAAPSKRKPQKQDHKPLSSALISPVVAADAFAGQPLLRTSDLFQARDVLCVATEAVIFSDGSCEPNPGCMGLGAVLVTNGGRVELFAGGMDGTNNAAELAAAHMALEALPAGCRVKVLADSQYLVFGMTKWVDGWRRKNFQRGGVDIPNADLWRALDTLNSQRSIRWEWLRGHNGSRGNELADQLAALGRAQP